MVKFGPLVLAVGGRYPIFANIIFHFVRFCTFSGAPKKIDESMNFLTSWGFGPISSICTFHAPPQLTDAEDLSREAFSYTLLTLTKDCVTKKINNHVRAKLHVFLQIRIYGIQLSLDCASNKSVVG